MTMMWPRNRRECAVALISTLVSSIGGGAAVVQHYALEQRRTTAQTKATNDAIKQSEQDRADRVAADAAARELRARVTALVNASRAPGDTAAANGGEAAGQAADLLVDVLGGIDGAAGDLAAYADEAHTAGEACERAYDALMPPQTDSGDQ
ncbi:MULTISPECIES: DUF2514 family protein [unclassified Cupriavidus]|uniref:DUF2514 family protein n=1 Tax=Cupriavidus sp. H19C3 TaxID=3241603 RepID=UPI003BF7F59C